MKTNEQAIISKNGNSSLSKFSTFRYCTPRTMPINIKQKQKPAGSVHQIIGISIHRELYWKENFGIELNDMKCLVFNESYRVYENMRWSLDYKYFKRDVIRKNYFGTVSKNRCLKCFTHESRTINPAYIRQQINSCECENGKINLTSNNNDRYLVFFFFHKYSK